MKKIICIAFICSIIALVTSFKKPVIVNKNSQEMATVYIYRVGQFGASMANWAVFADGQKICKLSNNKFIKHEVPPGKHVYSAKLGGVGLMKKETEVEITAEAGQSYYIACNVKQSVTRTRLELLEVTKGTGAKQMEKMTLDKCQEEESDK